MDSEFIAYVGDWIVNSLHMLAIEKKKKKKKKRKEKKLSSISNWVEIKFHF